ncbi:MAG TPA: glycosyltransferase family 4 protein [Methylomirabilota bacterium]|nr:glycosyltransferase family 4 protein [Methylomirabilota bacterium]
MSLKRLCIIEPAWTYYRFPVYQELSQRCHVDWVYSPSAKSTGFGAVARATSPNLRYVELPSVRWFGSRFAMIQWGIAGHILRQKPDAIFASANLNYLSFWTTLLLARMKGIPFYAHGHGLIKRRKIGTLRRLMMKTLLRLVTSYVAYAPAVRESLAFQGLPLGKVCVAENSLVNPCLVSPGEKTGKEQGILFIGRLRRGSRLGMLLGVVKRLRQVDGLPVVLHVVGSGEEMQALRQEAKGNSWVKWHGQVYDPEEIRKVSRECLLGCYPGDAGLSVVHMMSLSLPVITHDDATRHGPETSFIRNGHSGVFFDHQNPEESLHQLLRSLAASPSRIARMQRAAFQDYQSLVNPSLAERLWAILSESCEVSMTNNAAVRLQPVAAGPMQAGLEVQYEPPSAGKPNPAP